MTLVQRLTIWQAILVTCIIISLGAAVFGMMRWALVNDIDKMLDDTAAFINMNSRFVPLQSYDRSMPYSVDLPPLDVFRASGVEGWLVVFRRWSAATRAMRTSLSRGKTDLSCASGRTPWKPAKPFCAW